MKRIYYDYEQFREEDGILEKPFYSVPYMEMINLELRDPERPDSRGVRVFLGASGRLKAEGDEPVVELTINDMALELYNV